MRKALLALSLLLASLVLADPAQAVSRQFFDGFEDGTTNAWTGSQTQPRCTVVSSSADGVKGPFAGTKMARCNNLAVDLNFEELRPPGVTMGHEYFYRVKFRVDTNHDSTHGSRHKLTRFYSCNTCEQGLPAPHPDYLDIFPMTDSIGAGHGLAEDLIVNGDRWPQGPGESLQFGGNSAGDPVAWHESEVYINTQTGLVIVWIDGAEQQRGTWGPIVGGGPNGNLFLISNWDDVHDATNYVYFDNVEIWSDSGSSGVTGTLAGGDIALSGGAPDVTPPAVPTGLAVQ